MNTTDISFLLQLEQVIAERKTGNSASSYTAKLFSAGRGADRAEGRRGRRGTRARQRD